MDAIHRNFGTCDYLTSFGEKLSVEVLNVELGGDTTRIYADSSGLVLVDDDETLTVSSHFAPTGIVVVTGYCGRHVSSGKTVLLGRDGSDTTATLLSGHLECPCTIYTDVEGMFTIDPRLSDHARQIPRISLAEAKELAFHGASVLHAKCLNYVTQDLYLKHVHTDVGTVVRFPCDSRRNVANASCLQGWQCCVTVFACRSTASRTSTARDSQCRPCRCSKILTSTCCPRVAHRHTSRSLCGRKMWHTCRTCLKSASPL